MGPVTTPRSIDKAIELVEDAKKNGAKVLTGGTKLDINGGYFFAPTVITDAHDGLLVAQEEQFAPIAAFFPFDTEAEAVERANDTSVSYSPASPSLSQDPRIAKILTKPDGSRKLLLHQKHRPHMASAGKPRGRYDWHEHGQPVCCGIAVWRYQTVWLWQRVRQGCCCRGVFDYEDGHDDYC